MVKRIIAIAVIFIFTMIAWFILGGVTISRTSSRSVSLKSDVENLWGSRIEQQAPTVYYSVNERKLVSTVEGNKTVQEYKEEIRYIDVELSGSEISANIALQHRKKGLIWYSTYVLDFSATYTVVNTTGEDRTLIFDFLFPNAKGSYENFNISVDEKNVDFPDNQNGHILQPLRLKKNEKAIVSVRYKTNGMDTWMYRFNDNVEYRRNIQLVVNTDFKKIDFPKGTLSPTKKEETAQGWTLTWQHESLVSNQQIGVDMPSKINPGEFVSSITFFAPVSLFFFFFLIFIISVIKKIPLHPMHYFFLSAAFFSFHLLMAYMADHVELYVAFTASAIVSLFLVISYLRIAVNSRFAFVEAAIAQLVYLVVFSYAFFLDGFTGLMITILSIVTLFVVMQVTARINWDEVWSGKTK